MGPEWRHRSIELQLYVFGDEINVLYHVIAGIHSIMRLFVHYSDVIMSVVAPQITSLTIVYSTVYSGADQRKHQSSASLAFVRGIYWSPVNSPYKGPIIWKMSSYLDSKNNANFTIFASRMIQKWHLISSRNQFYLSEIFLSLRPRKVGVMMRTTEVFNCMKRVEFQLKNVGICSHWYNRGCQCGYTTYFLELLLFKIPLQLFSRKCQGKCHRTPLMTSQPCFK